MKIYLGIATLEWRSNGRWTKNELQFVVLSALLSLLSMKLCFVCDNEIGKVFFIILEGLSASMVWGQFCFPSGGCGKK
jgi:uncharacterized membrane protein